jgi:flagellar basal-body rod protein FlgB
MIDAPVSRLIENMLNLTARRQQALAANIANLDTPGYRATDFKFQDELSSIQLTETDASHLAPPSSASVREYHVESAVKPNGNDVNLERELTELTKNGLQYVTLIQYINSKLRTLRSSINEGGRT